MHTYIHTYTHARMHACMHKYIHTYTHIKHIYLKTSQELSGLLSAWLAKECGVGGARSAKAVDV